MDISVEISRYPLKDEYIPPILDFIDRLKDHSGLKVISNTMSTQIYGDYDVVFDILHEEIKRSFETYGRAIFVCKFIEGDLSPE
jgi:uncharacterized protein YqgV (UPF0045/DUF77 family)